MTLAFDLPSRRDSPLARLDPRWKLAACLLAALSATLLRQLAPAAAAWLMALSLALVGRVPAAWLLRRLGVVALVVGFFVVWLPWFPASTEDVFRFGGIRLSQAGCQQAAVILVRTLALVTFLLVLWATTDDADLFKAAHALYLPGLVVQLTALTYRYVFLLAEEFARLRVALRVRGFRNRMNRHAYRTIGRVAGSLLVSSHDRAERVAQAMRCRGFDGTYRTLHTFGASAADVVTSASLILAAAALLAWDWWGY